MESITLKTAGVLILAVLGITVVFGTMVIPTTMCETVRLDGEIIERNCETNQSLDMLLDAVQIAGGVSALVGLVGVWRISASLGRTGNFVGGGVLILTGLFIMYYFSMWFNNILSDTAAFEKTGVFSALFLLLLAGIGIVIGLIGCRMWRIGWNSHG
jgi:hypothetical protein